MTDSDDLFAETAPDESVFKDTQALDPLQQPETIRGFVIALNKEVGTC